MSDEIAPAHATGFGRWLLPAVLLLACLGAYFLLAPRIPPVVIPFTSTQP